MFAQISLFLFVTIAVKLPVVTSCKSAEWRNMTIEELMIKSDLVVYGKDVGHGKFRLPSELDARFDVYCVIKKGKSRVPGQVIIENIDVGDACSGVKGQTVVGQEYILGLTREMSGFTTYANVNPLQKTAFSATTNNFNKMAATCDLDTWVYPDTGKQDGCPSANKPRFCTKVRFPTNAGLRNYGSLDMLLLSLISTMFVVLNMLLKI